jgi:hypothetical protein
MVADHQGGENQGNDFSNFSFDRLSRRNRCTQDKAAQETVDKGTHAARRRPFATLVRACR